MIKELVNYLKNVSTSHLMIKSFEYGDSFNIEKNGETSYPNIFLEYPFNLVYSKGFKDITFSFYVVDLPTEGYTDDIELLNKVEQINEDILTRIYLQDEYQIISTNSLTFTEWMSDNTIAIRTDITFRVSRTSNNCEAPFSN